MKVTILKPFGIRIENNSGTVLGGLILWSLVPPACLITFIVALVTWPFRYFSRTS